MKSQTKCIHNQTINPPLTDKFPPLSDVPLKSSLRKIAFATAGATLTVGIFTNTLPAKAASFTYVGTANCNCQVFSGSLSFDDVSLTGQGTETKSLNQLINPIFALRDDTIPFDFPNAFLSQINPSFTFNNGNLIGFDSSAQFPNPADNNLTIEFTVASNDLAPNTRWRTNIFAGQTLVGSLSGNYTINTVTPFQSVPEPGVTSGLGIVALAYISKKAISSGRNKLKSSKSVG
ncbi:MAG TPA: hypothetical protein V6D15_13225 [Oculatellaceae cyanobacterium]